ncbi:hypothetical protein CEH05_06600 [Halobacillus halophilus]|nr:hypothetical protein CEH05_06600 [Halobacillus halophilus]
MPTESESSPAGPSLQTNISKLSLKQTVLSSTIIKKDDNKGRGKEYLHKFQLRAILSNYPLI